MKNIFLGLLFLTIIHSCISAISRNKNATHPDHPDKCYQESEDLLMDPEETYYPPGKCLKRYCSEPSYIISYSCGVKKQEGCKKLEHDLTEQYPKCCWAICVEYEEGYGP